MKKLVALMVVGTLVGMPAAHAAKKDKEKESSKSSASAAETRKKIETLKSDLNGSSWEIALTPTDGKGKEFKDTLLFQDNKILLKDFSGKGYKSTNYTITPPSFEGGNAVWETMQTSDKEGLLFIRGEWKEKDQIMRGIISHQKENEPSTDYNFTSQSKVTIEASAGKDAVSEAPAVAAPEPASKPGAVLVSKAPATSVPSKESAASAAAKTTDY